MMLGYVCGASKIRKLSGVLIAELPREFAYITASLDEHL